MSTVTTVGVFAEGAVRLFNRIGIALLVVVAGLSTAELFRDTPDLDVTTEAVTAGPIAHHLSATGVLQAISTAEVLTELAGTVSAIDATDNSVVHLGQVMAQLDPAPFEAALADAKTSLAQAAVDLEMCDAAARKTRQQVARIEQLSEQGLVAETALADAWTRQTNAQTDLDAARDHASEAQALVDRAAVRLLQTTIRAPIDGVLVATNVVKGQVVASEGRSRILFHLATDLTHLQIEAQFDEADAETLRGGDSAVVRVEDEAGEAYTGTIAEVLPVTIDDELPGGSTPGARSRWCAAPGPSRSVARSRVLIDVVNEDARLLPGMTATISLDGNHGATVTRIPNAALAFHPRPGVLDAIGETRVPLFAAAESSDEPVSQVWGYNGTEFAAVGVRTGLADDRWTELVSGSLSPGDRLVTNAAARDRSH